MVMSAGTSFAIYDTARSGGDGVYRLKDAAQHFGRERVRWALRDGQWQRPANGVVVMHNGPLTRRQQLWAAVLAAPKGSALGEATGAELGGLRGFERVEPVVVVPRSARVTPRHGVVVRRSDLLGDRWIHPTIRPPALRLERCVVDLAARTQTTDALVAPLAAAVQQRLTTVPRLRATVAELTRLPRRALVLETLLDIEGGSHSVPEVQALRLIRRRGLPEPVRQLRRRGPTGRYYLDLAWPQYGVVVEIDGIGHLLTWIPDLRRGNAISRDGVVLLRFASYQIRHEPDEVAETIEATLISAGWDGRRAA